MKRILLIIIGLLYLSVNAQESIYKGDSLYLLGNYTKAIQAYKQYSDSTLVFDKIAKAYIGIGNYDDAIINYKKAVQTNPKNALIKYEYAKLLNRVKKYEESSEVFYELIDIDYRNPNYHYELGIVLEHLNDSTAQNRFYSAFQLDRTHQKAIYRMAKHHLKKGANKLVNYYADIGLKSYPNNKELISLKAQNYYVKKDYDNAVIWFEKLIALNESSEFIHEKLRNCYMYQYEFEKAIEQGEKALKLDPNNTNNLFVQGELYDRIENFENAEKFMLQSLLIQDAPLDEEYVKLGSVYNRQKKYKEAIEVYKRAVEENPDNEHAQFFLVLTKNQYYKDIKTRIKLFETFMEKFPKSKFLNIAKHHIRQLKEEQFIKED